MAGLTRFKRERTAQVFLAVDMGKAAVSFKIGETCHTTKTACILTNTELSRLSKLN